MGKAIESARGPVESTLPMIYKAIPAIMNEISAIGKDSKNQQQNFKFRGIDAVMNELHRVLSTHNVFIVPTVLDDRTEERMTKSGSNLIYRVLKISFKFFAEDGSFVEAITIGEGMDSGDKASNKAMAIALKYATTQVFMIPTEELSKDDPDLESHEVVSKVTLIKQQPKKAEIQAKPVEPIKPVETFDESNQEHLERLEGILDAKAIAKDFYIPVSVHMNGKPMTMKSVDESIKQAMELF